VHMCTTPLMYIGYVPLIDYMAAFFLYLCAGESFYKTYICDELTKVPGIVVPVNRRIDLSRHSVTPFGSASHV
jgi:hypothetical protein